ncbi:MAG TPA: glycosyltransferase family 1 protein [Planctomycetota bacterium]|nr:glycosyltransferase family 1 protein [Planctomycetota bacterium]
MPKRIAIDATPLLFPGAGVWRVTRALLETMLRLESPYEFQLFARRLRGRIAEFEVAGHAIKRFRLPRGAADLLRGLGLTEWRAGAELYHATDHYLALQRGTPAVATIHDLIFMIAPEPHFKKDHDYFAARVPAFARLCRRIIAISEHTRRDIVERLGIAPEKIDVIPWAVDRLAFSPSHDERALRARLRDKHGIADPYFLAVSCSAGRKNTPRLLEAYAQLAARNPKHHLVVRWNSPAEIKARFQQRSLARLIHFIGPVDDAGLADLYRGATALAFPSLYEGFGLPVLEAMSCGTPAITSHNSSLDEVAGDAALYVDPKSTDSILSALEDFENDAPRTRGLREKGLKQADTFSWERTARMTLDVYAKAL